MSITTEQPDWDCLTEARAGVGEVPIYNADDNSLYWISLNAPSLNRTNLDTKQTETWTLPSTGGSYVLSDDGSWAVVAVDDGIYQLDFATSETVKLVDAPYDRANFRFNDGRCDTHGRFWVGTIRLAGSQMPNGSGYFYSWDGESLTQQITGVTVANGIAYSPDSKTMYLADRINARILAYDFDVERGTATGERVFTAIEEGVIADGASVDTDGGYWVAMFGLGEIRRYLPDGELDRVLAVPVSQPTMCAFGGPGLSTLYVTTARDFLSDEQIAQQPLAGAIFSTDVGESGLTEPRFAGSRRS